MTGAMGNSDSIPHAQPVPLSLNVVRERERVGLCARTPGAATV